MRSSVDDLRSFVGGLVEEAKLAKKERAWGRLAIGGRENRVVQHVRLRPDAFHFNIDAEDSWRAAGFDSKLSESFSENEFESCIVERLWELLTDEYGLADGVEIPTLIEVK